MEKETTYEEVCTEMKKRSEGDMKGVLGAVPTDCDTCSDGSDDFKAGIMLDPTPRNFVQVACWCQQACEHRIGRHSPCIPQLVARR